MLPQKVGRKALSERLSATPTWDGHEGRIVQMSIPHKQPQNPSASTK